jgi:fructan beta-fructosidase
MIPRPYYHFTPPQNFMNDPNGLVFFDGEYHLFYQHNPFGIDWGHMSWGHAVSRDLLNWEHLPVALFEENEIMIFSGSAVVDWKNTSGFGIEDQPPLIAIYTGHSESEQTQNIAYSTDRGRTWTKYAGNPVISIGSTEFRDPKVFWHSESGQWIMVTVLADRHQVRFDGSPDLKRWKHLSDFGPAGDTDGLWECPDLFALPVEGQPGHKKWVLKVDVQFSIGAQCFIGEFDGGRFISDESADQFIRIDYGKDFYAAQSWSDTPDGRRIWIAWMNNWDYARVIPTEPWRGQFTVPRELHLIDGDNGLNLVQRPIRELQGLRSSLYRLDDLDMTELNSKLSTLEMGMSQEIKVEFALGSAQEFGIVLRTGAVEQTAIGYDVQAQKMFVDRRRSGDNSFSTLFGGIHHAPLSSDPDTISFHIFIDSYSIEVFGNEGQAVISDLLFPHRQKMQLEFYASGGAAQVTTFEIWELRDPINQ